MKKILTIGNSFSTDATWYLYPLAYEARFDLKLINLEIGGCPLSRHFGLIHSRMPEYLLYFNSVETGLRISLEQALLSDTWDYVTVQQVSHLANDYATYQPYLNALAAYIRSLAPNAKILVHQTWAYEQGSRRLTQELGYQDQEDMFRDVKTAYAQAAADIQADGILPSGEIMQQLLRSGIAPVHRDTFHACRGAACYAIALVWLELLSGQSAIGHPFRRLDEAADTVDFSLVQQLAHSVAAHYQF